MTLTELIKNDLSISHGKKDAEIEEVVEMCYRELWSAGVEVIDDSDPRIRQAMLIFARYWFNWQGEGERYHLRFEDLKNQMPHCSAYNGREFA